VEWEIAMQASFSEAETAWLIVNLLAIAGVIPATA
jgi:hypothetical protein